MPVLVQSFEELNLSLTLRAGQVFGWDLSDGNRWEGVIGDTLFSLSQDEDTGKVDFKYSHGSIKDDETAVVCLREFFQLDIDLQWLQNNWRSADSLFGRIVPVDSQFVGLRICRQDPFECLISFIVSANNNIKRISQNLNSIRKKYGRHLTGDHYVFPTLEDLARATSEELRDLGLGYRAGYIVKTVALLEGDGVERLFQLRGEKDVSEARNFLMCLTGVGRKVADCVCLYSLDFPSIAPVDTHMYQIACRLFPKKSIKKDNAMHDLIQEAMIERFGDKAGWAHCFLFAADLPDLNGGKRVRVRE
jgi:N-glycosylase/DNA lyase